MPGTKNTSNSSDHQLRLDLAHLPDSFRSIAWSPDGRWLASGSDDRTVRVWAAETGKLRRTLEGHTDWVRSVAWSPDGRWLASGLNDGTVRVWAAETDELRRTLEGHTDWVRSVAWSPDGRWLASGSDDRTVRVWAAETGKLRRTLEGHTDWVRGVAWSPDGRWLASGSGDRTVRVWAAETGKLLQTLEGHTDWVRSVAWSPDGRWLASGSGDRTVRVWAAETGAELKVYKLDYPVHFIVEVSFQPAVPTAAMFGKTRLGDPGIVICTFEMEATASAQAEAVERYISAKIVLVGESEVGKSCLALRLTQNCYEELGTTHGMRLWPMPPERLSPAMAAPSGEKREVVIWDLGGQKEYRLVHQLFLHDTTLALMLLDPTRGEKAFEDVAE
jgi:tricorn protease-like protein